MENRQDIAVTMGIDYLGLHTELVNYQENGVKHNQHALVSMLEV